MIGVIVSISENWLSYAAITVFMEEFMLVLKLDIKQNSEIFFIVFSDVTVSFFS